MIHARTGILGVVATMRLPVYSPVAGIVRPVAERRWKRHHAGPHGGHNRHLGLISLGIGRADRMMTQSLSFTPRLRASNEFISAKGSGINLTSH